MQAFESSNDSKGFGTGLQSSNLESAFPAEDKNVDESIHVG